MDIYMPDEAVDLPIYIWIHGGHFKFGTGQWYGGERFIAEQDIVYVNLQYRLGVFGFLNVKDTKYTGNYGLMDQQLAIKFIYDNAHKIGGDKNRITIGGESAGSISSSFHMLVPESANMVQQAILQSGMPNAACGEWCQDIRPAVCGLIVGAPNAADNRARRGGQGGVASTLASRRGFGGSGRGILTARGTGSRSASMARLRIRRGRGPRARTRPSAARAHRRSQTGASKGQKAAR